MQQLHYVYRRRASRRLGKSKLDRSSRSATVLGHVDLTHIGTAFRVNSEPDRGSATGWPVFSPEDRRAFGKAATRGGFLHLAQRRC